MKKIFSMLLILCLASFVFTACGDDNGTNSNAPSNNGSDNPTPPPHEHTFVEGKCECGATDPNYEPPHEHTFVEGKCECGATDPNYEPPHEHTFVEGKCECGATDPDYEPPHEHRFVDGRCECGEIDPDYDDGDEMESLVYKAAVLPVKGGANGIVVLQHDDGNIGTAIIMDNLLRKYGLVADVALLSSRVWNHSTDKAKTDEVAKWREILDTGRWKITSHSATHKWWGVATELSDGTYSLADDIEKMKTEIVTSQKILRELFPDQRVLTFAYPGFSTENNKYTDGSEAQKLLYIYSEAARKLIDETYIAGRRVQAAYSVTDTSIDWTMTGCYHIGGNYTTNKVDQAASNGTFNVLYVHNMAEVPEDQLKTYPYPSNTMAAYYFEDTCKKLAARVAAGEVWNAHYEDAVMYLREAQSAVVSFENRDGKVIISLTDGMDNSIYNFPLTVRLSVPEGVEALKITQGGKVSYAAVDYSATEDGAEYFALCDIVPDSGEATVEPCSLSDIPEVKPEEPKPSPTIPEPQIYDSFEKMPTGNVGSEKFTVGGLDMRHQAQDNATVDARIVSEGENKYLLIDKTAIAATTSSQNWLNIIRDGKSDGDGGYIQFEARIKIEITTNASGLYLRPYNGRDAEKDGGTYPFNYGIKSSGGTLTYNGETLGTRNGSWFTMRIVMTANNKFVILIKNESGADVTVDGVSYANGEYIPRFSTVADGISTTDGIAFVSSSSFIGSFAIDYVTFGYVEPAHEHIFTNGECECGEKDSSYIPPECEHSFSGGTCTKCGAEDPSYIPSHTHNFVDGKCECGAESEGPSLDNEHVDDNGWTKP